MERNGHEVVYAVAVQVGQDGASHYAIAFVRAADDKSSGAGFAEIVNSPLPPMSGWPYVTQVTPPRRGAEQRGCGVWKMCVEQISESVAIDVGVSAEREVRRGRINAS